MTTMFYAVPALRHFNEGFADFPSRAMAERWVEQRKELGDDTEFGIFELRLVAGSARMEYGRTMHIRGDRRIITGKHYLGGYSAHDDGLGEDGSPYGYGKTPEEAIAELLEALDPAQAA
jgi:hypothetical protein